MKIVNWILNGLANLFVTIALVAVQLINVFVFGFMVFLVVKFVEFLSSRKN